MEGTLPYKLCVLSRDPVTDIFVETVRNVPLPTDRLLVLALALPFAVGLYDESVNGDFLHVV
jgi:hypothetical protein